MQWAAWLAELTDLLMPEGESISNVATAYNVIGALLSGKAAFDAECGFGAIYGVYAFGVVGLALGVVIPLYVGAYIGFILTFLLTLIISKIQSSIIRDFC